MTSEQPFITNSLLNPKVALPPQTDVMFSGESLAQARLDRIYFHGGIIAVASELELPEGGRLNPPQEIVLGLSAVGMRETEIAAATFESVTAVASRKRSIFNKLEPAGPGRMASAVTKAFDAGVFAVEAPIPEPSRNPKFWQYTRLAARGKSFDEIDRRLGRDILASSLRQEHGLATNPSAVLYGYAAGILHPKRRRK